MALAVLLAAAIGGTVFALRQTDEARAQRDRAADQSRISDSRTLVGKSLTAQPGHPELATLLAIEAADAVDGLPAVARYEARDQLLVALDRIRRLERVVYTSAVRVAVAPDGRTFATAGGDGMVRVWDVASAREVARFRITKEPIPALAVAFDPTGGLLAAEASGTVRFFDVARKREVGRALKGPSLAQSVSNLAWTPDGKTLAWSREDGRLTLWSVRTRKQLKRPLSQVPEDTWGLAVSPAGRLVATSDFTDVRVFDIDTLRLRAGPFRGRKGVRVTTVTLAPDGGTLAVGYTDGTIRMWAVPGGKALREPFGGGDGGVNEIAFSPDGRTLAAGAKTARPGSGTCRRAPSRSRRRRRSSTRRPRPTLSSHDSTAACNRSSRWRSPVTSGWSRPTGATSSASGMRAAASLLGGRCAAPAASSRMSPTARTARRSPS